MIPNTSCILAYEEQVGMYFKTLVIDNTQINLLLKQSSHYACSKQLAMHGNQLAMHSNPSTKGMSVESQ